MNRNYSTIEEKSFYILHCELVEVYRTYPEYNSIELGGGNFLNMVKKFADDDFYKLHLVAKRYLELNV